MHHIFRSTALLILLILSGQPYLYATDYQIPDDLDNQAGIFSDCTGTAPNYTCSEEITVVQGDTLLITADVNLQINDDFKIDDDVSVTKQGSAIFNVSIAGKAHIDGDSGVFIDSLIATGEVKIHKSASITGDVTSTSGNIVIDNDSIVYGTCTPARTQCTGGGGGGGGGLQCRATFTDGLTNSNNSGKIKFENSAQLLNNPDITLETSQIDNNGNVSSCDSANCNASGTVVPQLNGTYTGYSSNTNLTVSGNTQTISGNDYKDVKVKSGGSLLMSSSFSSYHFKKLKVESNSFLYLTAGNYFLEEIEIKGSSQIIVQGAGTARIYVKNKAKFKESSVINGGQSGDPSKLVVYFFADGEDKIKVESAATFAGYIYSEEKVEIKDNNSRVLGAISSEGELKLKNNSSVTYDDSIDDTDFGDMCDAPTEPEVCIEPGYTQVYGLSIDSTNLHNSVPYSINNAASIANGSFDRIAYQVELKKPGESAECLWVSMDAFTQDASLIGVPSIAGSNVSFQQTLSNMNVVSNKAGVVNGVNISTGNIEFWPYNYSKTNVNGVPSASNSTYDTGDSSSGNARYGSMQIHNHGANQTLFALNRFSNTKDLGIGNQSSGNPDWTFAKNSGLYTTKNINIYVLTVAQPLAEYRFDELSWNGSPSEVIDNTGNNHDGVAIGMSTSPSGQICLAGDFTSPGTGDYLSLANTAIDGLTDFTISVWAMKNVIDTGTILSGANVGQKNEIIMFFPGNTTFQPQVKGQNVSLSNGGIGDGAWHHLAWTRTGTNHCYYVDGAEIQCGNIDASAALDIDVNGLIIGQEQDTLGGGFAANQAWDGLLDELIIFDSALSLSKITEIFTNQNAGNNYDGSARTCPSAPSEIDHYAIIHDGQGLTCEAETITVKACSDASCSNLSTNSVVFDFLANGATVSSPAFSGSTTVILTNTTVGALTLSIANASIPASNSLVCDDGSGNSCDIGFTNAGFRFLYGAVNSTTLPNQISGSIFGDTLKLQAVENIDGVCTGLFSGSTNVDLSQENVYPSGTSGLSFSIDGSNIAKHTIVSSTTLTFGADSIASIPTPRYFDAGQIRLHANYDLAGVALSGSSNAFWVSPAELVASATFGGITLNGASANATPTHKAGEDFDLSVSALNSLGVVTLNYSPGQMALKLTRTGPTVTGSVDGNLSYAASSVLPASISTSAAFQNVTLTSFSSGVSTYNAAQYSEVGLIKLEAKDNNYGNTSIVIAGTPSNIGRFIPEHFEQTVAQDGMFQATCGPRIAFSAYSGQKDEATSSTGAISYLANPILAITAYNKQGDITQNYYQDSEGSLNDYMKLTSSGIGVTSPTLDEVATGIDNNKLSLTANINTGTLSQNDLTALPSVIALPRGVVHYQLSANDNFFYHRSANALVAPFTSDIDFSAANITDADNVNVTATVDASPAGVEILFGRLRLDNSFGPETSDFPQPMRAEHFDGADFIVTSNNNCTSYDASRASLTNISLDPSLTNVLGGVGSLLSGETQEIELEAPGAGNQGKIGVSYNTYTWLKYDWDSGGTYDDNPSATATFGIFRGHDRVIYWREVFN